MTGNPETEISNFVRDLAHAIRKSRGLEDEESIRKGLRAMVDQVGSRPGSTARVYAFLQLMEFLGIKHWSYEGDVTDRYKAALSEIADLDGEAGDIARAALLEGMQTSNKKGGPMDRPSLFSRLARSLTCRRRPR